MLMAIDPGREKCGIVVMSKTSEINFQQVIETSKLKSIVQTLIDKFNITTIILGNGTTSESAKKILETANVSIKVVDEKHTTEEARKLYWYKNPPKGWRRLLPTSMQVPPVPVDDLVAEILARRFINQMQ